MSDSPLIGVNPNAVVTSAPVNTTAPTLVLKEVTKLEVLKPKVTSPVPEFTPVLEIVRGLFTKTLVISACPEVATSISDLRTEPSSINVVPI